MWLTYTEAAERLGSTPEAVRQQSRRGRWAKQRPNKAGQPARIEVPDDLLSAPRPALVQPQPAPDPGIDPELFAAVKAHIVDLQSQVVGMQAQLLTAGERETRDATMIAFFTAQVTTLTEQVSTLQAKLAQRWWQRWRR